MAVATPIYSANTPITLDLSSLPASAAFTTGRESTEIDNTVTRYMDANVHALGITGSASVPTANQMIAVYLWGSDTSLTVRPIDTLDGLDSAETISLPLLQALRGPVIAYTAAAIASQIYFLQPFSVARVLGLPALPKFWGLYAATNLTGGLAAAMADKFSFVGLKYDVT